LVGLHDGSQVGIFVGLLIGCKQKIASSTTNLKRAIIAVQSFAFIAQ
jgi:hypothetical protein